MDYSLLHSYGEAKFALFHSPFFFGFCEASTYWCLRGQWMSSTNSTLSLVKKKCKKANFMIEEATSEPDSPRLHPHFSESKPSVHSA